jgi:hypothetical protein
MSDLWLLMSNFEDVMKNLLQCLLEYIHQIWPNLCISLQHWFQSCDQLLIKIPEMPSDPLKTRRQPPQGIFFPKKEALKNFSCRHKKSWNILKIKALCAWIFALLLIFSTLADVCTADVLWWTFFFFPSCYKE